MTKKFYITSAIPYVNAPPHIGHALEFIQVDTIARFHKLIGDKVTTLTGSDENALKNVQAAEKAGIPVQEFVDKNAQLFLELTKKLNTQFDVFQKGTSLNHFQSSQELWNKCFEKGDIYKKNYEGLYCIGCETFYTDTELNDKGECFEHPGKKLENVAEINYFFKLSSYQKQLIELIYKDELKIYPDFRKNEVLSFLKQPLKDISISRSNKRTKNWGVPVPNDPTQRMYVWFDALNIYRSGVEETIWPADFHVIGKGIIRFHAVYWPAFLLSAGLPLPKAVFVHGYLTVNGQKMSKTIGNIIDPLEIISKYGVDALRYYLLREIPPFDDGDFSYRRLNEIYNSDLANELGNLVMRITTLAEKDGLTTIDNWQLTIDNRTTELFNSFQFNLILESIWNKIKKLNKQIDDFAPWKKKSEERQEFLTESLNKINQIAYELQPFLPETAGKILKATVGKITKISPLFPRLSK
ncbi:MAG: methionine--tRNA ligase [Candidatus Roizmanbacteria bacterium]|nr:methionine--tRNA ligase [Candidatus Roizmanbacteria bacterium]